ncbi:hypothetical protein ACH4TV_46565 [Streptomyces sp. NPDC020898]|uniref:hypothetical protein n=1 Tax=Streptomyces sp. NPDC020898 TaxID=3365101 RepID=UPI0037BA06F4
MRDENAIIATSIIIEEPAEEGGDTTIVLDVRRARLDAADPRSTGYRTVLEQPREQRRPVYVEVGSGGGTGSDGG